MACRLRIACIYGVCYAMFRPRQQQQLMPCPLMLAPHTRPLCSSPDVPGLCDEPHCEQGALRGALSPGPLGAIGQHRDVPHGLVHGMPRTVSLSTTHRAPCALCVWLATACQGRHVKPRPSCLPCPFPTLPPVLPPLVPLCCSLYCPIAPPYRTGLHPA